MNTPYLKQLLLGKSIKELAEEIEKGKEYYTISASIDAEWWEKLIGFLVTAEDQNIRFVEDGNSGDWEETYEVYAPKIQKAGVDLIAEYDEGDWHNAEEDVFYLNNFVRHFYGQKDKKPKAKISKVQYSAKKRCPVCEGANLRRESGPYNNGLETVSLLGCDDCNSTWQEYFKLSGFRELNYR